MRPGTIALLLITLVAGLAAQGRPSPPQAARGSEDAVTAITRAFDNSRLVAIGELHRNQQLHDLLATLVRDSRFLPNGGDIVVEWGNARYQDLMDRYVRGDAVDPKMLTRVWRDTVNILVWDAPVYERLFVTVREVNRTRPSSKSLRVVLADPPIEWAAIQDRETWERIAATRDQHAVDVIRREVLVRDRRALLIFGSAHVEREAFDRSDKPGRPRLPNLAELLDREWPGRTLLVTEDWGNTSTDALLAGARVPSFIPLKGTAIGAIRVGPPGTPRLDELADAFLYLGPTASLTTSVPSPETYADTTYLRELLRRDAIQGGANAAELRRLSARFLNGQMR